MFDVKQIEDVVITVVDVDVVVEEDTVAKNKTLAFLHKNACLRWFFES